MQQRLFRGAVSLITIGMVCVAASSLWADEPKATSNPNSSEYRIGIEDVLDISVRNNPDLAKVVPVRPDGKISLPLINDIVVVGLTPMELRDVLIEKFSAYVQRPDVSVVVREIHSFKVSVIGSVKTPGRYELKGPSTVLDALALAEGFTEFASRRKITILRRDGESVQHLRFDYFAAVNGSGDRNMLVKPGDIIVVP
jgi:polysaccharide export outer membrane protein